MTSPYQFDIFIEGDGVMETSGLSRTDRSSTASDHGQMNGLHGGKEDKMFP